MDDYLNHGRVNSDLDLLNKKPLLTNTSRLKKDELYLSGYGRQWGEGLTYSAGIAYASGMALGGSYGALLGLRKGGATRRLFMNSFLNSCSTHGPALANRCAVITMFYCGFHSLANLIHNSDTSVNAAIAGGVSGVLYKVMAPWKTKATYGISAAAIFAGIDYASTHGFF